MKLKSRGLDFFIKRKKKKKKRKGSQFTNPQVSRFKKNACITYRVRKQNVSVFVLMLEWRLKGNGRLERCNGKTFRGASDQRPKKQRMVCREPKQCRFKPWSKTAFPILLCQPPPWLDQLLCLLPSMVLFQQSQWWLRCDLPKIQEKKEKMDLLTYSLSLQFAEEVGGKLPFDTNPQTI